MYIHILYIHTGKVNNRERERERDHQQRGLTPKTRKINPGSADGDLLTFCRTEHVYAIIRLRSCFHRQVHATNRYSPDVGMPKV